MQSCDGATPISPLISVVLNLQKQMQSAVNAGANLPRFHDYVTSVARDLPSTPTDLPDAIKTSFVEKPMQKTMQELPVETQVKAQDFPSIAALPLAMYTATSLAGPKEFARQSKFCLIVGFGGVSQKAGAEGASNKIVTNLLQFRGETAGSSYTANGQNFAGVAPGSIMPYQNFEIHK